MVHFAAQGTACECVVGVAAQGDGFSALDRDEHGAGVRAIERTNGIYDLIHGEKGTSQYLVGLGGIILGFSAVHLLP